MKRFKFTVPIALVVNALMDVMNVILAVTLAILAFPIKLTKEFVLEEIKKGVAWKEHLDEDQIRREAQDRVVEELKELRRGSDLPTSGKIIPPMDCGDQRCPWCHPKPIREDDPRIRVIPQDRPDTYASITSGSFEATNSGSQGGAL